MNIDEVCGVLRCCNDDDGSEGNNDVSIYIGIALFIVSEILPFLGVKANGVVHFFMNFSSE